MTRVHLLALSCGLWLVCAAAAEPFTLAVKSDVSVSRGYVSLLEVCGVSGASQDDLARLRRVYLGKAPGTYSREYIRFRLRQAGVEPARYRFSGAELAVVKQGAPKPEPVDSKDQSADRTRTWTVDEAQREIETALSEHLRAALGKQLKQVVITIENLAYEARRVANRGVARLSVVRSGKAFPGVVRVPVAFWDSRGKRFFRYFNCRVRYSRMVLVATRDLARGSRLSSSDVVLRSLPLDSKTKGVLDDKSKLGAWEVGSRGLRAGEALTFARLKRSMMIKNNDLVDVEFVGDGFKLTIKGRAQRGGSIGDRIPVLNLNSKKSFLAEVVGVRQVRLDRRTRKQ